MALNPGTTPASGFSESMAQAMEEALRHHWSLAMGDRPIPFGGPFLRILFVAIAQGVVRHLVENPASFEVATSSENHEGNVETIQSTGVIPPPRR